jgi:serine/threonine kinase 16
VTDKDGSKIVYIFLPYFKRGNLQEAIASNLLHHTHFSEPDMLRFFRGICYGVRALHSHQLPNVPIRSREDDSSSNSGIEAWDSREGGGNGGGRKSLRRQPSAISFTSPEGGTGLSDMSRHGSQQTTTSSHHDNSSSHSNNSNTSTVNNNNGLGPAKNNEDLIVPFAHRDIKPANVMIAEDGQTPVLMDFGSMARARVKIQTRQQALHEQDLAAEQCSMPYRAPELFDVKTGTTLDEKVDIWVSRFFLSPALCYSSPLLWCAFFF